MSWPLVACRHSFDRVTRCGPLPVEFRLLQSGCLPSKLTCLLRFGQVHTAFDYFNQAGVGAGLAGRPRDSFFITTMTSPCIHTASNPMRNVTDPAACAALTKAEVAEDLALLVCRRAVPALRTLLRTVSFCRR